MRSWPRPLRWATLAAVVCACSAVASGQRWATAIDAKSGRTYYWNKETRETTWLRPAELNEPPPAESFARDEPPVSSGASTIPSTASPEQQPFEGKGALCEACCALPCTELNGDVEKECGACSSQSHECYPGALGYPDQHPGTLRGIATSEEVRLLTLRQPSTREQHRSVALFEVVNGKRVLVVDSADEASWQPRGSDTCEDGWRPMAASVESLQPNCEQCNFAHHVSDQMLETFLRKHAETLLAAFGVTTCAHFATTNTSGFSCETRAYQTRLSRAFYPDELHPDTMMGSHLDGCLESMTELVDHAAAVGGSIAQMTVLGYPTAGEWPLSWGVQTIGASNSPL